MLVPSTSAPSLGPAPLADAEVAFPADATFGSDDGPDEAAPWAAAPIAVRMSTDAEDAGWVSANGRTRRSKSRSSVESGLRGP